MEGMNDVVKVGGKIVQAIRFVDDQATIAFSESGLQRMIERTNCVIEKMRINIKRHKLRKLGKKSSIMRIILNG